MLQSLSAPLKDWSESNLHTSLGELPDELACDEDTVFELLANLDTSKSSGPDGISPKILKNTAVCITSSASQLFNLSIKNHRVLSQQELTHLTTTD